MGRQIKSRPLQVSLDEGDLPLREAGGRARGWTRSRAPGAAGRALPRPAAEDPLLELSGLTDGLPPDSSEHFNRYFAETIVAERPAADRARRRRTRKPVRR